MSEKKTKNSFGSELILNNPVFGLYLGICSTLAISTNISNAIGMGIAVICVLTVSNIVISLIAPITPDEIHIPVYIVVIATLVTIVSMLMHAYTPTLFSALGAFLDLIVVNCIILGRAESYASKNPVLPSIFDGIGMGLGFTFGLTCIAIVREFIGTGAIFGVQILPLADAAAGKGGYVPVTIFILPAGAFLVLAFLVAGMNKLKKRAAQKGKKIAEPQGCGTDCASCGGCGSKVFPTGNEE